MQSSTTRLWWRIASPDLFDASVTVITLATVKLEIKMQERSSDHDNYANALTGKIRILQLTLCSFNGLAQPAIHE